MSLNVVFMGTPEFSIPTLSEIQSAGHNVVAVYTQPPKKAGRGGKLRQTPVHQFAEKAGLPVFTPKSLKKPEAIEQMQANSADIAVVIAYGLILPKAVLEAFPLGCLNVHGSLLPRWRGAAPIQRAIMAGDKETGVMIMAMDEGLDTGDIVLSEHMPIPENMTAGELHDDMMHRGASLLARALEAAARGSLMKTPQPEKGVTYAEKISKSETRINWARPAAEVHNHIRGLSPWPGAWFMAETAPGKSERIKVLKSSLTGPINSPVMMEKDELIINAEGGAVNLIELQREGKKPVDAKAFINGLQAPLKLL